MAEKDLRINSKIISEGEQRAPNRAHLRAVGFKDEDFKKPMIGIASTWSEVTRVTCILMSWLEKRNRGPETAANRP